jgi:hypothetical protein
VGNGWMRHRRSGSSGSDSIEMIGR